MSLLGHCNHISPLFFFFFLSFFAEQRLYLFQLPDSPLSPPHWPDKGIWWIWYSCFRNRDRYSLISATGLMHWEPFFIFLFFFPCLQHLSWIDVLLLSWGWRDASKYLVITVWNKLGLFSEHNTVLWEGNPASTLMLWRSRENPFATSVYDCLLCPTLLFFDSTVMMLGINRMVDGSVAPLKKWGKAYFTCDNLMDN